ncbi:MAG: hypothetical protein OEV21_07455 [Thermoplasmata archaeon]|nr:hypothetical protein [Thermoplasmata archaeon]
MKGSICECGYKTIALAKICPRCGNEMVEKFFSDFGKVLTYVKLRIPPENYSTPLDLAMVEIDNGPQITCWTDRELTVDQIVRVLANGSKYSCEPV